MNDASPPSSSKRQPPPPPNSSYPYYPYQIGKDEINLVDYWRVLVRYKVMIIVITLLVTFSAVTIAWLMKPIYRAEVLLAPVSNEAGEGMSAISSQFGGFASLAGINIGPVGGDIERALATIKSRNFLRDFITDNQLMQVLFADKWDASAKTWKVKVPSDAPTVLDAYGIFQKNILNIDADNKTGLVTLAIEWEDPQQAASWANELVGRLNNHEKQLAIEEAERSIAYLKEQLAKTSVVEMQQVIYQLMEAQTKKIMLAKVRDQYTFKVIDPAVVPEKKIRPNGKLITVLGFIFGLTVSILVAFLRSMLATSGGDSGLGSGSH